MEIAVIVMGIIGCVFGLLGLVASIITGILVLGWKNSTHKVEYIAPPETREEYDVPADILAQLPSNPEPRTVEQYVREARQRQAQADSFYEDI